MTDFISFFFPKSRVIKEPIDPREEIVISDNWPKGDSDENFQKDEEGFFIPNDLQKLKRDEEE